MKFLQPSEAYRAHTLAEIENRKITVIAKRPPNFAAIEKVFPAAGNMGVMFAYGPVIYNPTDAKIPARIMAHEATHGLQQEEIGTPELWWQRYLEDRQFVLDMELDAHRIEYREFLTIENPNRHERRRYLVMVAQRLSGPLYNHMIQKKTAMSLIKEENEDVDAGQ